MQQLVSMECVSGGTSLKPTQYHIAGLNRPLTQLENEIITALSTGRTISPRGIGEPIGQLRIVNRQKRATREVATVEPDVAASTPAEQAVGKTVDADFLRRVLVGEVRDSEEMPVTYRGLYITGFHIVGDLDLSYLTFLKGLTFTECQFSGKINIAYARLGPLFFERSYIKELAGSGARIDGDLSFEDSTVQRNVNLERVAVAGTVCLDNCSINKSGDQFESAISFNGAEIDGSLWLRGGCTVQGLVDLIRATIGGRLDCSEAKLWGSNDSANTPCVAVAGFSISVHSDVWFNNAFIKGHLEFENAKLDAGFSCLRPQEDNPTDTAIDLSNAKIGGDICIEGVFQYVYINGAWVDGALRFHGDLKPPKGLAFSCTSATVKKNIYFVSLKTNGIVVLNSVSIGGDLTIGSATLSGGSTSDGHQRPSFMCFGSVIHGSIYFGNCTCTGGVVFFGSDIKGELHIHGNIAMLGGTALDCGTTTIGKDVRLYGLVANGTVSFDGAKISGDLVLHRTTLTIDNAGIDHANEQDKRPALSCDAIEVRGSVRIFNVTAVGCLGFHAAIIGSEFHVHGDIRNPQGYVLECTAMAVGREANLCNLVTQGRVNFIDVRVEGDLCCQNARLSDADDFSLDCLGAHIGGNVLLDKDISCDGGVRFSRAKIKGSVQISHCALSPCSTSHMALELNQTQIGGMLSFQELHKPVKGLAKGGILGDLDLRQAHAHQFYFDSSALRLGGYTHLDGFTFDAIADARTIFDGKTSSDTDVLGNARTWINWLTSQPKPDWRQRLRPQPFLQVAKVLSATGHRDAALSVLKKREQLHYRYQVGLLGYLWGLVLNLTAGYGVHPLRAVRGLVLVLLFGWFVFYAAAQRGLVAPEPDKLGTVAVTEFDKNADAVPSTFQPFNGFIYSLDVLVPFAQFKQKDYWLILAADERHAHSAPLRSLVDLWVGPQGLQTTPLPRSGTHVAASQSNSYSFSSMLAVLTSSVVRPAVRTLEVLLDGGFARAWYWTEVALGWLLTTIALAGFTGFLQPKE